MIKSLRLIKHPEGGYYRETYRSPGIIQKNALPDVYTGDRNYTTLIYYLLVENDISCLHRLPSDEIWHFYFGSTALVHVIDIKGQLSEIRLGNNLEKGDVFHTVIKAGNWFGAEVLDRTSFSLFGCTVAPGFHFDDDEIGEREKLINSFPVHKDLITRMTYK